MKQFFVAIFLVASLVSFAQKEFAPIGAEWYYEKMLSKNPPEAGYIKLTSIKDSTIENKAVRVIEVVFAPNDSTQIVEGYEYLHQSGDTIWYWKNKQFHMLYNFAMQKGDSILLYSEMINQCSMNDPYGWNRVDSVFTRTYNGLTLKSYTSSPINQSVWGFEMHTSEIFGNLNYLIPQNKGCSYDGIAHGPLRCYSDPVHGVLFTSMPQMKCDSTYTYTGPLVPDRAEVHSNSSRFVVSPNPVSHKLDIRGDDVDCQPGTYEFMIVNLSGSIVKTIHSVKESIDVSDITNGAYFLIVAENKKIVDSVKFLKQSVR